MLRLLLAGFRPGPVGPRGVFRVSFSARGKLAREKSRFFLTFRLADLRARNFYTMSCSDLPITARLDRPAAKLPVG